MIMTPSSRRAEGPPACRDESVMIIAEGGASLAETVGPAGDDAGMDFSAVVLALVTLVAGWPPAGRSPRRTARPAAPTAVAERDAARPTSATGCAASGPDGAESGAAQNAAADATSG